MGKGDARYYHDDDGTYQPSVGIIRKVIDFSDKSERPFALLGITLLQEMRQEHQAEQSAGHQCNRRKDTEVFQHFALGKEKSEKSSDSGYAAQTDRCSLIPQDLFRVAHIFEVREDMQDIADGHAQDNRTDSE